MDITFEKVNYIYQANTPFAHQALKDISFHIPNGSFTAIIGHTGSGKSTLIQHLNGLVRPTTGKITIGPFELTNEKNKQIKQLRKEVGMVFQYPEHQLFEETVKKDILFGPKNFGIDVSEDELLQVVKTVGLPEEVLEKSPFELSGGQMRRVAIASILVMNPKVLVLDEPTAGLDPLGKYKMMELFAKLHKDKQQTTILITHDMEDALAYADQIVVLDKGTTAMIGEPLTIFKKKDQLKSLGLNVPEIIEFITYLKERLNFTYDSQDLSIDRLAQHLSEWLKEGAHRE
ncbi:energy-coupling factor transporter ATPase [Bacillaceae bacterium W0354]